MIYCLLLDGIYLLSMSKWGKYAMGFARAGQTSVRHQFDGCRALSGNWQFFLLLPSPTVPHPKTMPNLPGKRHRASTSPPPTDKPISPSTSGSMRSAGMRAQKRIRLNGYSETASVWDQEVTSAFAPSDSEHSAQNNFYPDWNPTARSDVYDWSQAGPFISRTFTEKENASVPPNAKWKDIEVGKL